MAAGSAHRPERGRAGGASRRRGHVGGVVGDEAEKRRAAGVLPEKAEEVQPGTAVTPEV
jgi:hypothetical protein